MGCLIYIFLLPIYSLIIICSFFYSIIYLGINIVVYLINKVISFFKKDDFVKEKPEFKFEQVIVTKNKFKKEKYKKGKVIDVKIEEEQ